MQHVIEVENIKCGGCANSINNSLRKLDGVQTVEVDIAAGRVTVTADSDCRERLLSTLLQNGYPEKGSTAGLQAAKARAKSFVSCAIGKLG